ncbi:GNAT family N-acetyltransferase [Propionibacteriaceae bacterium G1746]|uniref:GNAT family N-acetyltransferase n=1 Tax=Aestuariimicrobium sp. G57 TaxID=3418485 RepID=UPI003C1345B8
MADLVQAAEHLDDPIRHVDLAELERLYRTPDADPGRNAVVGRDRSGSVVATAWGHPRRGEGEHRYWLEFIVHPAWRYQHVGEACAVWLRDIALDWHEELQLDGVDEPLWAGAYVDEKLTFRVRQFEQAGFVAERWFADMHVTFAETDPHALPLVLPDGVRLVDFDMSRSEAVRRAHNRTYATVPGAQRVSRAVWEHMLDVATLRRESSAVALAGDEVVGYAISADNEPDWPALGLREGWTEFLGTVPEWRGRGIARALLTQCLRGYADAGLAGAGLGVDADSSHAYRLFSDLGYRATDRLVLMGLRRD